MPFDRRQESMEIRCFTSIYLLTHHKTSRESFDLCVTNNAQCINEYSEPHQSPEKSFRLSLSPVSEDMLSRGDRHVKYTSEAEAVLQAQQIHCSHCSAPAHHRYKILYPHTAKLRWHYKIQEFKPIPWNKLCRYQSCFIKQSSFIQLYHRLNRKKTPMLNSLQHTTFLYCIFK